MRHRRLNLTYFENPANFVIFSSNSSTYNIKIILVVYDNDKKAGHHTLE